MKKLPLPIAFVAGLLVASPSGLVAATTTELLSNSTLSEDKNWDGWPDGWPRGAGLGWHRNEPPELCYIRLQPVEPGKSVLLYRDLRLPPGATSISFVTKARAQDVVIGPQPWHDARVVLEFLDAEGKKVGASPAPLIVSRGGSKDWRVFSGKLAVPAGASKLSVLIAMFNCQSGTLDIGLLEITADDEVAEAAVLGGTGATGAK